MGLSVLLVVDDADAREMLSLLLSSCGARVRIAASARDALGQIAAERPGVLLVDLAASLTDGDALIREVRALPRAAGGAVPAIALTLDLRSDGRTRLLLAGFTNHVAKPVGPLELVAVIASIARLAVRAE